MRGVVIRSMYEVSDRKYTDYGRIRSSVKNSLSEYIARKAGRRPVIMIIFSTIG